MPWSYSTNLLHIVWCIQIGDRVLQIMDIVQSPRVLKSNDRACSNSQGHHGGQGQLDSMR